MNNLINTDNNCTIKTTTVQYRQQQYNKDNNSTIKTTTVQYLRGT